MAQTKHAGHIEPNAGGFPPTHIPKPKAHVEPNAEGFGKPEPSAEAAKPPIPPEVLIAGAAPEPEEPQKEPESHAE